MKIGVKIFMVVVLLLSFVFAGVRSSEAAPKCRRNIISWVVPLGAGGGTDRQTVSLFFLCPGLTLLSPAFEGIPRIQLATFIFSRAVFPA